MTVNIKDKAITLRKEGYTYKQIVENLDNQISIDWCKRNLKDVQKGKVTDACIEELIMKATRPEGLSVYEANAIIYQHNKDKKLSVDDTKNIRKKAVYANSECLFRPAWIDATKPVQAYKSIMAYTGYMLDQLDYVVRQYIDNHPTVNSDAVKYEIMKYMFPKISPEPLSGRIMRTEVVAERLANRGVTEVSVEKELVIDTEDKVYTDTDYNLKEDSLILTDTELDEIWKV